MRIKLTANRYAFVFGILATTWSGLSTNSVLAQKGQVENWPTSESETMSSLQQARELLNRTWEAHAADTTRDICASFTGRLRVAGARWAPNAMREYTIEGDYRQSAALGASYIQETYVRDWNDSLADDSWLLLTSDQGIQHSKVSGEVTTVDDDELAEKRTSTDDMCPITVLRRAMANGASLRLFQQESSNESAFSFIDIDDRMGDIYVDSNTHLIKRIESIEPHHREGDQIVRWEFAEYAEVDGIMLPDRVQFSKLRPDITSHSVVNLDWELQTPDESAFRPPAEHAAALEGQLPAVNFAAPQPSADDVATFVEIGKNIFALDLPERDSRTLVAVFGEYLVMLEAPVDPELVELTLGTLRSQFPDKPIRAVAFSHHHSHYMGGLRPYIAREIPIVTTAGNAALVQRMAEWPRQAEPDLQTIRQNDPIVEITANGSFTVFEDESMRLEVHEIGEFGTHTDEYQVFYFPQHQLLFAGDNVRQKSDSELPGFGKYANALLQAIEARKMDVQTVIQSWPIDGYTSSLSFDDLQEAKRIAERPTDESGNSKSGG